MLDLYVDADACPVKNEIYRVADRYDLRVWMVANMWMRVPDHPKITLVTVTEGLDAADHWIVERIGRGDIKQGARAIGSHGHAFTEDSIGETLATRNLMAELRETGEIRGGGRPFGKQDRSRFLQTLDGTLQAIRRTGA